jgi:2-keto-4-pentenoate hydratase
VDAAAIPALVEQLGSFRVQLARDGEPVAEGGARNCLKSPALCLVELARAVQHHPDGGHLHTGSIISSGTLTESQFLAPEQTWTATLDGLDLPPLTLRTAGRPRG